MTAELKQQYTRKITQANKTQLIVILYEMVLLYVEEAKEAHTEQNRMKFRGAIQKTRGCINELMASLHFEYEPAMNLLQLYLYVNRELARADMHYNQEPLAHVEMVITSLHKAYEQVSKEDTSGPVMENTQTLYVGLTYGKNQLTENLADQGSDRGFLV